MVTIKDVALRAGLPEKTAARALAGRTMGKRRDAKERAERVFRAAAELGYQPSEIAKALRRGKTKTIGMLIGSITNRYFSNVAETAMDESEKNGYRLILELTRWNETRSMESLNHLQRLRVDGVLYVSAFYDREKELLKRLSSMDYPVVMRHNNDLNIPYVQTDHRPSFLPALDLIQAHGHREVCLLLWNSRTLYDLEMKSFCEAECGRRRLGFRFETFENFAEIDSFVDYGGALLCNAPNALKRFYSISSVRRPEVIGIYDEWNFIDHPAELSGVMLSPSEKVIRAAVRMLIDRIENRPVESCSIPSCFYRSDEFASVPVSDYSALHLQPF